MLQLAPTGKKLATGTSVVYEHDHDHVLRFTPLKEVVDNIGEAFPASPEAYMQQKIGHATAAFHELRQLARWNVPEFTYLPPAQLDGVYGFACVSKKITGRSLFVISDAVWHTIPNQRVADLIQGYRDYILAKYAALSGPLWNDVSVKQFLLEDNTSGSAEATLYMVDVDPLVFEPYEKFDVYDGIARLHNLVEIIASYYDQAMRDELDAICQTLPPLPAGYSLRDRNYDRWGIH